MAPGCSTVACGADARFRFGDARAELLVDHFEALLGGEGGLGLGLLSDLHCLAAARVDPLAIGFFGRFRLLAGALRGRQVAGNLPVAVFHDRLDLRDHAPADPEVDDAEHQQQPEQLRVEDLRKLLDLRHLTSRSNRARRPGRVLELNARRG